MVNDMEDIDKLLAQIHSERISCRKRASCFRNLSGKNDYTMFRIWCDAYYSREKVKDVKLFGKYLKEEGIELTFWQLKYLAEKYFGYKYKYDVKTEKWTIEKTVN